MKVPAVVQTTRMMSADMATDGRRATPTSDSPSGPPVGRAPAGGLVDVPEPSPSPSRWSSPRGSANQLGPSMPTSASSALTAPGR